MSDENEIGKVLNSIKLVEYETLEEVDETGSNKDVHETVLVGGIELVLVKEANELERSDPVCLLNKGPPITPEIKSVRATLMLI
jgi:hypothetical protein